MGKKSDAPPAIEMEPVGKSKGAGVVYDTTGQPRPSLEMVERVKRASKELSRAAEDDKKPAKSSGKGKDLKKEIEMDEHIIDLKALCDRFGVNDIEKGHRKEDIPGLLKKWKYNELSPPAQTPMWIKFLKEMTGFFSLLLWLGGILCFGAFIVESIQDGSNADPSNAYLGAVLIVVVFITGVFTFLQNAKSSKIMEGFKKMVPTETVVKRDGQKNTVNAREIVPGDIVYVVAGDKIPADIRIIEEAGLKVDNSSLTGESEPQSRGITMTDKNPLETKNLAFGSTLVIEGTGTGIVVRTADNTLIGKIAGLASGTETVETPIHKEIHHFVLVISSIAIFLGTLFFGLGFINNDFLTNCVFAIGIIVANVPEGLLATVTVSLTLTANRMKNKQVLVKHLESVETLGSTTTICSDKTGTLTQNNMSVAAIYYDNKIFNVSTLVDNDTEGDFDVGDRSFKKLHRCGALCNKTVFAADDDSGDGKKKDEIPNSQLPVRKRKCIGDASETAIVKFCEPLRNIEDHREKNERVGGIPFNSTNKWMITIHKDEEAEDGSFLLCMKGAPERVLDTCTHYMFEGRPVKLTAEAREKIMQGNEELARRGMRVLGFAEKPLPAAKYPKDYKFVSEPEANFPTKELIFIGLYALIDPPRAGVPEAVLKCHRAGIKVIMVTGDQPTTAKAIAQQVNIIKSDTVEDIAHREGVPVSKVDPRRVHAIVVHGSEVKDLTESDWERVLNNREIVFARTSPQQKLIIVEHCQNRGEIVAVTGDGVNDSPALKKADIGVAMGIAGSDVSKEAANMILMDDNFASIVNGIEEGRLIFDNLKKSIAYTLSSNIPEITPFLFFIIFKIPIPLTTVLILTIDLGTDMIPAISLAYEQKEADIMNRPPRDSKVDRLVTHKLISFAYLQIGIIQALAGFYVYFVVFKDYDIPILALFRNSLADDWETENLNMYCYYDSTVNGNVDCKIQSAVPAEYTAAVTAGQINHVYTQSQREDMLQEAQTSFLVTIVIVQWADLLICKTRKLSILQQGMKNGMLNFGLVFETLLMVFLCYVPFISDTVFKTYAIPFKWWMAPLPFCLYIFVYDELRKFFIRGRLFDFDGIRTEQTPFSRWLFNHTYW